MAALLDPSLVDQEIVKVPGINWDMMYDRSQSHGRMVRIYQIDRDRTFELLYRQIRFAASGRSHVR